MDCVRKIIAPFVKSRMNREKAQLRYWKSEFGFTGPDVQDCRSPPSH